MSDTGDLLMVPLSFLLMIIIRNFSIGINGLISLFRHQFVKFSCNQGVLSQLYVHIYKILNRIPNSYFKPKTTAHAFNFEKLRVYFCCMVGSSQRASGIFHASESTFIPSSCINHDFQLRRKLGKRCIEEKILGIYRDHRDFSGSFKYDADKIIASS